MALSKGTTDGPTALRRQPVLRREPHVRGEGARQALRFQDIEAVIDVLDAAYDEGMHTFMCTTHDRIAQVSDHVRANPDRYANFTFYPGMPYAHKYANAVTENGMLGAVNGSCPTRA